MEFKCCETQKIITVSKKISREIISLVIPFQMKEWYINTKELYNNWALKSLSKSFNRVWQIVSGNALKKCLPFKTQITAYESEVPNFLHVSFIYYKGELLQTWFSFKFLRLLDFKSVSCNVLVFLFIFPRVKQLITYPTSGAGICKVQ